MLQVFEPKEWASLIGRSILPKLAYCLDHEFTVNPVDQKLEAWEWTMTWSSVLPRYICCLLHAHSQSERIERSSSKLRQYQTNSILGVNSCAGILILRRLYGASNICVVTCKQDTLFRSNEMSWLLQLCILCAINAKQAAMASPEGFQPMHGPQLGTFSELSASCAGSSSSACWRTISSPSGGLSCSIGLLTAQTMRRSLPGTWAGRWAGSPSLSQDPSTSARLLHIHCYRRLASALEVLVKGPRNQGCSRTFQPESVCS